MSGSQSDSGPLLAEAAEVLRAYLEIALHERFLQLHTEDILAAASDVWNNHEPGGGPRLLEEDETDAESGLNNQLVEALHQARSTRFAHQRFFFFALDYEYEDDDMLFGCDIMWPDRPDIYAFRHRVSRRRLAPPERN